MSMSNTYQVRDPNDPDEVSDIEAPSAFVAACEFIEDGPAEWDNDSNVGLEARIVGDEDWRPVTLVHPGWNWLPVHHERF
jgi:hypothetical protein